MTLFIILGWYSDGSLTGPETVVACFATRLAADRFVELANMTMPAKTLAVVAVVVEP